MKNTEYLAEKLREDLGVTKKRALKIINVLVINIMSELEQGNKIKLNGLGTFEVKMRAARRIVNPNKLDEMIQLSKHKAVKFTSSETLKKYIKNI